MIKSYDFGKGELHAIPFCLRPGAYMVVSSLTRPAWQKKSNFIFMVNLGAMLLLDCTNMNIEYELQLSSNNNFLVPNNLKTLVVKDQDGNVKLVSCDGVNRLCVYN
jgi:hypothetical protein